MFSHIICVIAISIFGFNSSHCFATDIDTLYQTSLDSLDQQSLEDNIQTFKKIIKTDKSYAPAYHQLAKLYLALNTINDRQRAQRAIKDAIRLDKKNIEYQLTYGDLLWAQGYWNKAEGHYQKAFQLDTLNASAAYEVGYRAVNSYIKFKDQNHIDVIYSLDSDRLGPTYHMFYWKHFGEREFEKAITFLERSIQIDPALNKAYHQLALVYYEKNQPEKLIETVHRLLKMDPNDQQALLFCGLGYQALHQESRAYEYYIKAIHKMDDSERAVMESVETIAVQKDPLSLSAKNPDSDNPISDIERQARFWKAQDPLFLTPFSERRMEHYRRVAYANLRFGRPEHQIAGWQTDMGQAYIQFGAFLNRRVVRAEGAFKIPVGLPITQGAVRRGASDKAMGNVGKPFDEDGFKNIPSNSQTQVGVKQQKEVWIYEDFQLDFVVPNGRDGRLVSPKSQTPHFIDPYKNRKYNVPHQVVAFKTPDGIRLEIAYALPRERFLSLGAVDMEDGLFIFDEAWHQVYQDVRHMQLDRLTMPSDSLWHRHFMSLHNAHVLPGNYLVAIENRERRTNAIGTFREFRTFDFSDSSLALSDLLLARNISEKTDFPEKREDLHILPNPLHTFYKSEPVFIYFEIYNLEQNEFGRTQYELSYQLSVPDQNEIDVKKFSALNHTQGHLEIESLIGSDALIGNNENFAQNEAVYRVKYILNKHREAETVERANFDDEHIATKISAEYEGSKQDDFTYLQLDLAEVPAGVHKLSVKIQDHLNYHIQERDIIFRVLE